MSAIAGLRTTACAGVAAADESRPLDLGALVAGLRRDDPGPA
ncbi:hypothetical protein AB0L40_20815 [Patulibacter sp. NPDC049589]